MLANYLYLVSLFYINQTIKIKSFLISFKNNQYIVNNFIIKFDLHKIFNLIKNKIINNNITDSLEQKPNDRLINNANHSSSF